MDTWLIALAVAGPLVLCGLVAFVAFRRPRAPPVASARLEHPGAFTLAVPPGPEKRALWLAFEVDYPDARRENDDDIPQHYALVIDLEAGGRREKLGYGALCPRGVRVVDDTYGGRQMTLGQDRCSTSITLKLATYASSPGVISGTLALSPDATLREATLWVS